ncbi:hypothetical protein OEZ85_004251 [Tetradesmus obliquus]|uniref:Histidine biosynthesis HisG C-terminal domain-containing protein n=1 Tax=Tetradesmus obliquus TaxID=3088 RepID=A0ABY8UL70_TETOB|nr:hypothetical protein OEZ85_004251 [Tetradesmus obliquus]
MRGESPEAVATLLMQQEGLRGLQGPTISPVYSLDGSHWHALNTSQDASVFHILPNAVITDIGGKSRTSPLCLLTLFLAALPPACLIANMRGESPEAVATLLMQQEGLRGLQGPTISPVYSLDGSASGEAAKHGFYACVICVAKKNLYPSVKALQKIGGSGVLVQPMTYIFDEEPLRWQRLLAQLGIDEAAAGNDPAAAAAVLASNGAAAQEAAPARR